MTEKIKFVSNKENNLGDKKISEITKEDIRLFYEEKSNLGYQEIIPG